jgi:hypothetical protein
MRSRVLAGLLAVSLLATAAVFCSLLAAGEVTRTVVPNRDAYELVMRAQVQQAIRPIGSRYLANRMLCNPGLTTFAGQSNIEVRFTLGTPELAQARLLKQARCLSDHGYLHRAQLAGLAATTEVRSERGLARVIPAALRLDLSPPALAALAGLVGADVLLVLELVRRRRLRSGISF